MKAPVAAAAKPAKPVPAPRRDLPREVRIIGGQWKRSKLAVAAFDGLRPTPDRVRETLFNWLGQDLTGWRCLDAFAGSGALGFEAASRGADQVVLVERERRVAGVLNEARLRLRADALRVECGDALSWMVRCAPATFELVFIDPPFESELLVPALDAAVRLVVPSGYVYVESEHLVPAAAMAERGLRVHRQARAGSVHFCLLQRADPA